MTLDECQRDAGWIKSGRAMTARAYVIAKNALTKAQSGPLDRLARLTRVRPPPIPPQPAGPLVGAFAIAADNARKAPSFECVEDDCRSSVDWLGVRPSGRERNSGMFGAVARK